MTRARLTREMQDLHDQIKDHTIQFRQSTGAISTKERDGTGEDYAHARAKAKRFHQLLVQSGQEPVHRSFLISNRRCEPSSSEFYDHIHAIDSLLSHINDTNSNNDPKDITMGSNFTLRVYSAR